MTIHKSVQQAYVINSELISLSLPISNFLCLLVCLFSYTNCIEYVGFWCLGEQWHLILAAIDKVLVYKCCRYILNSTCLQWEFPSIIIPVFKPNTRDVPPIAFYSTKHISMIKNFSLCGPTLQDYLIITICWHVYKHYSSTYQSSLTSYIKLNIGSVTTRQSALQGVNAGYVLQVRGQVLSSECLSVRGD